MIDQIKSQQKLCAIKVSQRLNKEIHLLIAHNMAEVK